MPTAMSSSSLSRRHSLTPSSAAVTGDIKHRVITCLNKLSDRDTLPLATNELESIAKNLTVDSFSPFLTCIHNTDSSAKSPVRKQCVSLLTTLSHSHSNSLSSHLPKMVSTVVRRLRDPDSAVRSACVEAVSAMSTHITAPPFSALSKPLIEVLTVEQDFNSQIGAAMCLAAAIEATPEPDVEQLRKVLPRLGKLAKSEGFKAKAAVLGVMGSIVVVGGAKGKGIMDWLVTCLLEFLSSEDWATRKSAAEAMGKVALAEKELCKEHKASCLTSLETRRFDKVKLVRETMNRTMESWKEVPSISEEVSVSSKSGYSSSVSDNAIGGCLPFPSKASHNVNAIKTHAPKKIVPASRSLPSDASQCVTTSARKQPSVKNKDNNLKAAIFQKQDHKRPSGWKIEIAVPRGASYGDDDQRQETGVLDSREDEGNEKSTPETKRVLFSSTRDDKLHKFGGLRSGSRVVPFDDEDENCYNKDVKFSNHADELYDSAKDIEDLSLIRDQLVQIENQQSNLLDLMQRFIGSSQNGINSLESRVNGLEMALDEMSYDLAMSSGRIPNMESAGNTCCKLPGADFLSSKFWRRTEDHYPISRSRYYGGKQSFHDVRSIPNKGATMESYKSDSQKLWHPNMGGYDLNQETDACTASRGFYPGRRSNIVQANFCNASGFTDVSTASCRTK